MSVHRFTGAWSKPPPTPIPSAGVPRCRRLGLDMVIESVVMGVVAATVAVICAVVVWMFWTSRPWREPRVCAEPRAVVTYRDNGLGGLYRDERVVCDRWADSGGGR